MVARSLFLLHKKNIKLNESVDSVMETVSYIIDDLNGYEAAKLLHTSGKMHWLSTSPSVLHTLKSCGENVISLESGIDAEFFDSLGQAGYDFTESFCNLLNEKCDWKNYADLSLIFAFTLNQCFFTTFYKAKLLQNVVDSCLTNDRVVCVGDSTIKNPLGFSLLYNRFENLFAILGKKIDIQKLNILEHKASPNTIDYLTHYSKSRRMGVCEQFLSLINSTPGSFLTRALAFLNQKCSLPFRHISLFFSNQRCFYVHNRCELIDEILPQLLMRGAKIGFLPTLPKATSEQLPLSSIPYIAYLEAEFSAKLRNAINQHGIEFTSVFNAAESILIQRFFTVLARLYIQLPRLTKEFDGIVNQLKPRASIISNALTIPEERLFTSYCRKKGVEVIAFEHGLVYGLSKWSSYCAQNAGMLAASTGVYHSAFSRDEIAPYAGQQRKLIGGLPQITRKIQFKTLQRFLGRKILGVEKNDHLVIFVANLDRNNFVYGPFMENDLQNYERTKSIMDFLIKSFPTSIVILKLYPTSRYLDQHDWPEYAEMKNVRVIRDIDFRFIRAAADVIFVGSSQSTLGWCLGSGAQVFFLETAVSPVKFLGCSFDNPGIAGVRSVKSITMHHFFPKISDRRFMYKELLL